MAWLFYYLSMYLMTAGIRLSSLWNDKSKKWITGRKNWFSDIQSLPKKSGPRIWFHVSSLGEFEQARPVMENLKRKDAAIDLILTFFSPSGYEMKVDYPLAHVFYLPADLPGIASQWVKQANPDLAVFVKYDLWAGYLKALQNQKIPTLLISAYWLPGTIFHSSAIPPTRALLKNFNRIFFQKADHIDYFKNKGFSNLEVAGDTRIDRCLELPNEVSNRLPDALKGKSSFHLIAGSTWPADEKMLIAVAEQLDLRMIIAPHNVSDQNIKRLLASIPFPAVRLSEMHHHNGAVRTIVVDSIGLLNVLYALGHIAYIGGGFGAGIHNTLEPAAHHRPVLFGPAYDKFPEAIDLIKLKAAWSVKDANELKDRIEFLLASNACERAGEIAFNYLSDHSGASEKITTYILKSIEANN